MLPSRSNTPGQVPLPRSSTACSRFATSPPPPCPVPPSLHRFLKSPSPKQSTCALSPSTPVPTRLRSRTLLSQFELSTQAEEGCGGSLGVTWGEALVAEDVVAVEDSHDGHSRLESSQAPEVTSAASSSPSFSPAELRCPPLSPTSPALSFYHRVNISSSYSPVFRSIPRLDYPSALFNDKRRPSLPHFRSDPSIPRPRTNTYPTGPDTHLHTSPEFSVPFLPSRILSAHPSPSDKVSNDPFTFLSDEIRYPSTPPDRVSSFPLPFTSPTVLYASSPPTQALAQLSLASEASNPSALLSLTKPAPSYPTNTTLINPPPDLSTFSPSTTSSPNPPTSTRILACPVLDPTTTSPSCSSTDGRTETSKLGLGLSGTRSPPVSLVLVPKGARGVEGVALGHLDTPQPSPEMRREK